ncbi:MAG: hypothetical protein WC058_06705 [Phycisphaeraceae bacterium]
MSVNHTRRQIALKAPAQRVKISSRLKFLRDVMHVIVSRGQSVKLIGKVSAALAEPYRQLRGRPTRRHAA